MELRLLRYFVTVAEELHFSRAAVRLHMAQPPLSQQIRRLEEELGVQLLARTRRRVELTEPGRAFLASAREILDGVDLAVTRVQRMARGEVGSIALGVMGSVAYGELLPRVLRVYRERYPAVSVDLREMPGEAQLAELRAGRIQVGFLRPPVPGTEFVLTPFQTEPLVAVLPSGHPLAGRDWIPLKALRDDAFITVRRDQALGGADLVAAACRQAGFTPRIAQETREFQSVIGYVAAGFGVSLLPRTARQISHGGVAFVALAPPEPTIEIGAVHLARNDSPLVAAFLGVLAELSPGSPARGAKATGRTSAAPD